jgi:hypothetical protein
MLKKLSKAAIALSITAMALVGCGSNDKNDQIDVQDTIKNLYTEEVVIPNNDENKDDATNDGKVEFTLDEELEEEEINPLSRLSTTDAFKVAANENNKVETYVHSVAGADDDITYISFVKYLEPGAEDKDENYKYYGITLNHHSEHEELKVTAKYDMSTEDGVKKLFNDLAEAKAQEAHVKSQSHNKDVNYEQGESVQVLAEQKVKLQP